MIDNIQCNDAELQASLAAIRMDKTGPNAKRNNFENAVQFLLPSDPVAKKRKLNNNNPNNNANAQISLVDGNTDGKLKPSIGKTGVHFRYYKGEEYKTLSNEQKLELREWRSKKESSKRKADNSGDDTRDKKKFQREIASVVKKLEESRNKDKDAKATELKEITDVILAATTASASKPAPAPAPTIDQQKAAIMATQIQGIMSHGGKKSTSD